MLKLLRVLVLIGALSIVALGAVGGSVGVIVGLLGPAGDQLTMVTAAAAFLFLTVSLGAALAWQSWRSMQGQESGPFRVKWLWLWGLLYVLALVLGQLILAADLLPVLLFPPLHVVVAILPPLILLMLVALGLRWPARWRDIVLQTSSGALLSAALAFTLEAVFVLGLLFVVFAAIAVQPGGTDLLELLAERLQDPSWLQDPASQASLSRSPLIVAGIFFVLAVLVPIIEESVKTVGVGLMSYRRPTISEAFLWGVACGAGFALVENLFNTTGGLDVWAPMSLLRLGAALLHCFTGGLMGLAWYFSIGEGRWVRALALFFASVGIHAVWNALAAGMTLVSLTAQDGSAIGPGGVLAGFGVFALLALLVLLAVLVGFMLLALTIYVRKQGQVTEKWRSDVPTSLGRVSAQVPAEGVAEESL